MYPQMQARVVWYVESLLLKTPGVERRRIASKFRRQWMSDPDFSNPLGVVLLVTPEMSLSESKNKKQLRADNFTRL